MIIRFFDAVDRGEPGAVALLVLMAALWVLLVWRFCHALEKGMGGR